MSSQRRFAEDYAKWIETLLGLGGVSPADATKDAATILRIETALAKAQMGQHYPSRSQQNKQPLYASATQDAGSQFRLGRVHERNRFTGSSTVRGRFDGVLPHTESTDQHRRILVHGRPICVGTCCEKLRECWVIDGAMLMISHSLASLRVRRNSRPHGDGAQMPWMEILAKRWVRCM